MTTTRPVFEPSPTWQPGDPLYSPAGAQYRLYLFNFRDDADTEDCQCGDAATWPRPSRPLPEQDELEAFIAEHRRWAARVWVRQQLEARLPWLRLPDTNTSATATPEETP